MLALVKTAGIHAVSYQSAVWIAARRSRRDGAEPAPASLAGNSGSEYLIDALLERTPPRMEDQLPKLGWRAQFVSLQEDVEGPLALSVLDNNTARDFEALARHPVFEQWLLLPLPAGIFAAAGIWSILLLLAWACPFWSTPLKVQAADRVLGTIHAIVATGLGLMAELYVQPVCFGSNNIWMVGAVQLTAAFLIVDGMSMLVIDVWQRLRPVDTLMFAHHIVTLTCLIVGTMYDFAVWFLVAFLINEASTPVLHVLWYLQYSGRKETKAYVAVGVLMVLVFCCCRIVFIPYLYYQFAATHFCREANGLRAWLVWLPNPFFVAMWLMNLYWFTKLIRGAVKKLRGLGSAAAGPDTAD